MPNFFWQAKKTMGISVEGQKCPVCGSYIFDNDDLVFCPDCGAPHHRDCYAAIGHCAYGDKHGTPEEYKRPEPESKKPEAPENEENTEKPYGDEAGGNSGIICRECGEEIPKGHTSCPNCGYPITSVGFTPFGTPIIMDPLGGVSPNDMIDDIPAKEVKDFVAVNTARYLPRFKNMNDKKKKSWNWAAFLFPYAWFFYRKMYLSGILFFLLTVAVSILSLSYVSLLGSFPDEVKTTTAALTQYLMENISKIDMLPIYLTTGGLIAEIILRIVAGFTGDRIYRNAVLEGIRTVKKEGAEMDVPLSLELRRKGGVNMIMGIVGIFALQWITTLIYAFM